MHVNQFCDQHSPQALCFLRKRKWELEILTTRLSCSSRASNFLAFLRIFLKLFFYTINKLMTHGHLIWQLVEDENLFSTNRIIFLPEKPLVSWNPTPLVNHKPSKKDFSKTPSCFPYTHVVNLICTWCGEFKQHISTSAFKLLSCLHTREIKSMKP